VAPNRAITYLHPTDVTDARALWVNPAGLGRSPAASVHLDLTVGDPGTHGRLRQLTFGVNSRGISFGYQRDIFDGGVRGTTYRVGLGVGHAGLAAGVAAALYRGSTRATGWDCGVVYELGPMLAVGGVVANIGQPVVRSALQVATFLPSVTLRPFGDVAAFSADGRITADSVIGYAFGARFQSGGRARVGLLVRLDTDRSLRRTALVFGVSIGGRDLVGAVASTPGDASRVDTADLYGVSTRRAGR
jgi:hypothetical protein